MYRLKLLLSFILLTLSAATHFAAAQEGAGGLRFYSQDQEITKMTSFHLFNDSKSVEDSFRLEFDFRIYDPERFGDLFRIFEETTPGSDTSLCHFLSQPGFSEGHYSLFFIQNYKESGKILIAKNDRRWIPFSLAVNRRTGRATVACNDSVFRFPINLPKKLTVNVVFGLLQGNNAEVAAFDIRNVRFQIDDEKEYFWPLKEKSDHVAHEINHGKKSGVKNPNWLINEHFYWDKVYQGKADVMCGIDFNEKSQEIVLVNKDSILYFNVASNKMTAQLYNGQRPFEKEVHFSILNPKTNELISYDFHFLAAERVTAYSVYHPESQTWTDPQYFMEQEENHLHVMFWNNDTTRLIRFGGYSQYKYFNEIRSYDFETRTWVPIQLSGDVIYPRSGGAIGKNPVNQLYYLYGGLGNKDGQQVLGVQNFHDLYSLDFNRRVSKKIWELDDKSLVFVPRSQMVVKPSDSSCYVLCNQGDRQDAPLCLYRFSLHEPKFELVSDSLPSNFYTISDKAFLFKNNRLSELYAVVRSTPGNKSESQITIYKLDFPPTPLVIKQSPSGAHPFLWIIVPLVMVIVIVLVFFFFILKKARKQEWEELERTREAIKKEAEMNKLAGMEGKNE